MESITAHRITAPSRPPTEQTTVSDYNEFVATVIRLITEHETSSQLLFFHDGDDINEELERARFEITGEHPIGAFAVSELTLSATRIVTAYEIDIGIEYKRTKEQIDSIVTVSTERFMRAQLQGIMSSYKEEAIFRSTLQVDEDDITLLVNETYYGNPQSIVMLPVVAVEIFPDAGVDRIYMIQFGYTENQSILQRYGELLTAYIQRNVEQVAGNTDSEILLSLVSMLAETIDFDERTARTTPTHGSQNLSATAFGALMRGRAVGEGFAMAFKALTEELGFTCYIVLGELDGMVHAWNIISLYGDYYHIDVSMCAFIGLEAAFLKTDEDFEEMLYTWDRESTVLCEGELTLADIMLPEDPDQTGDNASVNGTDGEDSSEED